MPGTSKSFDMQEERLGGVGRRGARPARDPQADVGDPVAVHVGGQRNLADSRIAVSERKIDPARKGHRRAGAARLRTKIELEHVVSPRAQIDNPVAVKIADDREATEIRRDDLVAGVDREIVIRVKPEVATVEQPDLVAVGGVAIEIAGKGNPTRD